MTIRLRAHHLLCMLTYVGKGYTPGFVDNYEAIAARLSEGEEIELVAGPDDICQPLLDDEARAAHALAALDPHHPGIKDRTALPEDCKAHCHEDSVLDRDAEALASVSALLSRNLTIGTRLTPNAALIQSLRQAFKTGQIRKACEACEWSSLCDSVSDGGYEKVRINPV